MWILLIYLAVLHLKKVTSITLLVTVTAMLLLGGDSIQSFLLTIYGIDQNNDRVVIHVKKYNPS